jgi:hypothetical protein
MSKWLARLVGAAAITITVVAVCQELEKPKEAREWHGRVGRVPYDFRLPTLERFMEAFWNPDDSRIFTTSALGIGWAINFYALLDKMRIIEEYYASEEDFLMPTPSLREVLEHRPAIV